MATKKKQTMNERRLAKKAAAKKANRNPKKPVEIKRKPRQQRLTGMEDAATVELESKANDLADVQDQRRDLGKQGKVIESELIALMKKHGKTRYSHKGVHIDLTTSEKAKVVIKDEQDDTPADPGEAPAPNVNAESMAEFAEG